MKNQPLHPHTVVINKKQQHQSKTKRQHALLWLKTRFPHLFENETNISPLKIGIAHDLMAYAKEAEDSGISKSKLREALALHTRRIDYLACLKAREMRIDLEGKPTTRVTEEEAEHAANKIRRIVEKNAKNARAELDKKQTSPSVQYEYKQNTPSHQLKAASSSSPHAVTMETQHTTAVTVKRKNARAFDPTAVQRLKEKLGIPQSNRAEEAVTN